MTTFCVVPEQVGLKPTKSFRFQNFGTDGNMPSKELIRSLSRDVGRVYPSLSVDDQAKILAYRMSKSTVGKKLSLSLRSRAPNTLNLAEGSPLLSHSSGENA